MFRVWRLMLVSLFIVSFLQSRAYSQTSVPDSVFIQQQETEGINPESPVSADVKTDSNIIIKPSDPSLRLEGFSMYNFGAAYLYSSQKMTGYNWWDGTSYTYNYTTTVLVAGVSWNYLAYNGFSLGGSVGLFSLGTSRSGGVEPYYSDYSSNISMTLIGPRIAQYFGKKNSKLMPFVAGEMDIITSSYGSYGHSEIILRLGGGAVIKLVPKVGISIGLDYLKFEDQKNVVNILGTVGLVCMPF